MLFIDIESREEGFGTSFTNTGEANLILDLMRFMFKKEAGALEDGVQKIRFDFSKIGFVSPYSAQTSRIK
jgi:hypothetical protein